MFKIASKSLSPAQINDLKDFGQRISRFGVNFACCDADSRLILLNESDKYKSDERTLVEVSRSFLADSFDSDKRGSADAKFVSTIDNQFLAVVLRTTNAGDRHGTVVGVALVDLGDKAVDNDAVVVVEKDSYPPDDVLAEMLRLFACKFQLKQQSEAQIENISTELAQVYEELVLLHKLSNNMRVTEPGTIFLQMACDSLTDIVSVEGIAILQEKNIEDERKFVLIAGSGLIDIDENMITLLYNRLIEQLSDGKEALLDSEVDSPLRYDWPQNINNIIVVPLYGKEKAAVGQNKTTKTVHDIPLIGMMVAVNRIDKPDFDSTDVKLFNSVANECAVFLENGRLFKDLEELFIGSLKALTSSIDAKDQYTRGHSERVAIISRWIAERLVEKGLLEEEQVPEVYLAGLLHDIGKLGVDEAVLRKGGKLTEEEFERLQRHPLIGAEILSGIKQMRDIVPGVLCHHERVDGKGYPHGLTGDRIPLIGKIVGLADSFGAMTSERTYRAALSVEQALEEIKKGLGSQFDEKVGGIFINSDVYQLHDMVRGGFKETYWTGSFAEYGTTAVGALIR